MNKTVERFSFRKGQQMALDEIYGVMGLGGGDWWEQADASGEKVVCVQTIKIKIEVTKEPA